MAVKEFETLTNLAKEVEKMNSSYSEEQKLWRLLPTSLNSYQDADIFYIVHIISVKLQQKAVVWKWKVKALK